MTARRSIVDVAELGRARALRDRNNGRTTGKHAAGWNVARPPVADDWHGRFALARAEWKSVSRDALNSFRAACLNSDQPDQWEILL